MRFSMLLLAAKKLFLFGIASGVLVGAFTPRVGSASSTKTLYNNNDLLFTWSSSGPTVRSRQQPLFAQKKKTARDFFSKEQLEDDEGYGILGSLTRQGPIPVFVRIFQADNYNLSVEKFMAQDKCSRTEAMANMDAYFNDPTGWQIQRKKFEKTGVRPDYVNAGQSQKSLALTAVWGVISSWFIWRIYQYNFLGVDYEDNFWGF
eukprot:scaffold609_cov170-Amphora_coffeaeformis.AAC.53